MTCPYYLAHDFHPHLPRCLRLDCGAPNPDYQPIDDPWHLDPTRKEPSHA